jgi:hypothetical protein
MVQETGGCSGLAAGWKVQGGGVLEHIIMEDSSILEHGVDVKARRRHPQTRRCWGRAAELEVEWRRPGGRRHGGRATVFRQPLFRPRSFFHGGRRLAPSHVDAGEPAVSAHLSPPPPFPPAVPSSDLADSIESGISFRGGTQGSRTAWMLSCWSGTGAWGGGVAGALAWKNMGIWYCRSCEAVCFLRGLRVGGNFLRSADHGRQYIIGTM